MWSHVFWGHGVCILQHEDSTQNIMPSEGQQGIQALTAAYNKDDSIKHWHQLTI